MYSANNVWTESTSPVRGKINKKKTEKFPWKRHLFHVLDVLCFGNFIHSACIHLKDAKVGLHYLNRTERNEIEWAAFVKGLFRGLQGARVGKKAGKNEGKSGNVSPTRCFFLSRFSFLAGLQSVPLYTKLCNDRFWNLDFYNVPMLLLGNTIRCFLKRVVSVQKVQRILNPTIKRSSKVKNRKLFNVGLYIIYAIFFTDLS